MEHAPGNERARYGQPIVAQVTIETEREFGRNFHGENFEEEDAIRNRICGNQMVALGAQPLSKLQFV
jgi:hypothetical protein